MVIIACCIQWNTAAIFYNGLQDVSSPYLYLWDVSGTPYQEISWYFWDYYFLLYELLPYHPKTSSSIKYAFKELPNMIKMVIAGIKLNIQTKTEGSCYCESKDGTVTPWKQESLA